MKLPPPLPLPSLKEISVIGAFEGGNNFDWFGLTVPVPFKFSMQYDLFGVDQDPDPTHGLYEFIGMPVELTFGPFTFNTNTTEVHIYSGFVVGGGKLWGTTFGSGDSFIAHNLVVDPYGIYGSFLSPYQPSQIVYPTDELKWLFDGEHLINTNSYFQINGTVHEHLGTNSMHEPELGERVRFQDEHPTFSVRTVFELDSPVAVSSVPEPMSLVLALVGVLILLKR